MPDLLRGARRPLPVLAFLLASSVLAACTGAGTPSGSPGAPETSPSGAAGAIGHATGATDVILRAEQAGGFTPLEFQITRVPEFTLYGDGTVLYQLPFDPNDASPLGPPRLAVATLSPEQMDALLAFAINAGGLGGAKAQYINPLVADAPDTIFTIATDDVTKTVTAQALGAADDPTNPDASNPDAATIKALKALYDTLVPFGDQIARGNATDAGLYQPTAYRATLQEGQTAEGEMHRLAVDGPDARRLPVEPRFELPGRDSHPGAGRGAVTDARGRSLHRRRHRPGSCAVSSLAPAPVARGGQVRSVSFRPDRAKKSSLTRIPRRSAPSPRS